MASLFAGVVPRRADNPVHELDKRVSATKSEMDVVRRTLEALSLPDDVSPQQLSASKASVASSSKRVEKAIETACELISRAEDACEKAKRAGEEAEARFSVKTSIEELGQQFNNMKLHDAERKKLESSASQWENYGKEVKDKWDRAEDDLDQMKQEKEAVEEDLDQMKQEKEAVEAENTQLKDQVQALQDQVKDLQRASAEDKRLAQLTKRLDDFNKFDFADLGRDMQTCKATYNAGVDTHNKGREKIHELEKDNQRLLEELTAMKRTVAEGPRGSRGQTITPGNSFASSSTSGSSSGQAGPRSRLPTLLSKKPLDDQEAYRQCLRLYPDKPLGMTTGPGNTQSGTPTTPDPFVDRPTLIGAQTDSRTSQRDTALIEESGSFGVMKRGADAATRTLGREESRRVAHSPARSRTRSENMSVASSVNLPGTSTAAMALAREQSSQIPQLFPTTGSRQNTSVAFPAILPGSSIATRASASEKRSLMPHSPAPSRNRSGQSASVTPSTKVTGSSLPVAYGSPDPKRQKTLNADLTGHGNGQEDAVVSATTTRGAAPKRAARPSQATSVRKPPKKSNAQASPSEDDSPKGIDDLLGLLQVVRDGQSIQAHTLPEDVKDMLKPLLAVYMEFSDWYGWLKSGVRKPKCAHAKLSHEKAECSCAEHSRLHIQLDGDSKTIVPNGDLDAPWEEVRYWIADTRPSSRAGS